MLERFVVWKVIYAVNDIVLLTAFFNELWMGAGKEEEEENAWWIKESGGKITSI